MADFAVLLDAPTQATGRIQIAKIGDKFKDSRYGDFGITEAEVENWGRNLALLPGGRAPIDEDHRLMKSGAARNTRASGWITGVEIEGGTPYATVEWTPKGRQAIENKEYLFISPAFGTYKTEMGEEHPNTLISAGLTNSPFLNMPALTLASESNISKALERDPVAKLYQLALDGELGEKAKRIALDADGDDDTTEPDNDADDPDGTDTAAKKKKAETELAALVMLDVSQAERDKAKEDNNSLPDGSYPINNTKQLKAAAVLAASKHGDYEAAKRLIRRRAKELGVDIGTLNGFGKKEMSASADIRAQMFSHDTIKSLASIAGISDESEVQKLLDLADQKDATEDKVLEAIEAAKPAPKSLEDLATEAGVITLSKEDHEKLTSDATEGVEAKRLLESRDDKGEPDTRTLEQRAAEEGKSLIDADTLKTLEDAATKVKVLEVAVTGLQNSEKEARAELATKTFETKFEEALRKGKATPSQKESLQNFYTLDAEATLKMLDEAPVIVNVKSIGRNVNPVADEVPEGVHAEHAELESRVRAYMGEHEVDYVKALEAVTGIVVNV